MEEDYGSSSSEAETEAPRQVWQFKKLWTTTLDSVMSNSNVTSEELVRRIVALANVDMSILDEVQTPVICFKPEKAKHTEDDSGSRVQIVGVMFKPGMEGLEGKRWKLIAENSLYSYMLPMLRCKIKEQLPYEQVYIVLNGAVDESSHQIRLDQDYKKTVVIAVTSGPLSKAERAVHSVLSFNFKLSWSNAAKYRELTVEPLHPDVEDMLLYLNYLPSRNRCRPGATTAKIRKYLQQEVVEGSLKDLNLQHRAEGDGCDTATEGAGSNEGLRDSVDEMETNQNGYHQKPPRKNKADITVPPPVEENTTDGEMTISGIVTANAEKHVAKSSAQTATSNSSKDERRVPAANRETLFKPTSTQSPDIPEPVTVKKRPGPRSKTMTLQLKQAKDTSSSALTGQENTTRGVLKPKPSSKAPAVQSNEDLSTAKSMTDQEVLRNPDSSRHEANQSLKTKSVQAEKQKDPQVTNEDEAGGTHRTLSKEFEKVRKHKSVYGFDTSPLEDTTGVHESSPETTVPRNSGKLLDLDESDFNDNNIVINQESSKGDTTDFADGASKDKIKRKTYTISSATESSSESTTVSRDVSPSEERNASQGSKSSSNGSVISAVRAAASAVMASDNDKTSSTFTAVKRSTLSVSSKLGQVESSSAAIAEVPEESVCGEQTRQSDVNGTDYQGPPKASNRKFDRNQDENEEQPQAKKKKASENGESKYRYDSLRRLSSKLAGDNNAVLQKRNILAVVEQVLQVGTADKKGFCRDIEQGTYIFRIGDLKNNGVLARMCPMRYNPDYPTEQMKLGPSMKIGDVIRIHRATVQFELQYGENQMVISTSPHHNYALFDGSKGDDEMMGRRGLAQNPSLLSEGAKATIKKLWEHWSRRTMVMEPEVVTVEEFLPEVAQEPLNSPSKFASGAESASSVPVSSAINNETCSTPPRPRRSPRKLTSPPGRLHVVHEKNSQDVPESQATLIDPDPAANIRDSDVEEDPMITDVQEVNDLLTSDEDRSPLKECQNEEGSKRRKTLAKLHARTKLPLRSSGSYIVKYANARKEVPVKLLKDMNFELDGSSYNLFGKIEHFWMRSHKNTYTLYIDFTDKTTAEYDFLYCNKDGSEGEGNAETVQIEVSMEKHERALVQEVSMKSALPALLMNVRRIPSANLSKLQTTISNVMFIQNLP